MIKYFIAALSLMPVVLFAQDTTKCLLRIDNIKRSTSKQVRGYEVTIRESEFDDVRHVEFLRENKRRIKTRRNRRVFFIESLM
jgi:hypothetical protein